MDSYLWILENYPVWGVAIAGLVLGGVAWLANVVWFLVTGKELWT